MAETGWDRLLSREKIAEIYERAGLRDVLLRQRQTAHMSGERVEDLSVMSTKRGQGVRSAVLDANEKSGVPIKQLMTERPGY